MYPYDAADTALPARPLFGKPEPRATSYLVLDMIVLPRLGKEVSLMSVGCGRLHAAENEHNWLYALGTEKPIHFGNDSPTRSDAPLA